SQLDYYITDLATDARQYMRDATASIAVLAFEVGEASPLSTRFMAEVLKLVASADKLLRKQHVRPLIRSTPTTLHVVYQTDIANIGLYLDTPAYVGRPLFEHGLAFTDALEFSDATLHADCGPAPLDGGTWLAGRTPLNTPRDTLPMWNGDGISTALRDLVDRWVTAGELREREAYRAPPPKPAFEYGELNISVDPDAWDLGDARRNIPGVADEVRRRRAALGLKHWEVI
ncbi:MAG: hypothetical protein WAM21_09225, partial [Steroidobacteraceae bacterium]